VSSARVTLKKPLERRLRAGHPWIYRDALEPFTASPGEAVTVIDRRGKFVARGLADAGPIGARVFSLRDEDIGSRLFTSRIARALELRARLAPDDTDALRLVHGEGDRLPGFVVDRYGEYAVLKPDGAAALARVDEFAAALRSFASGLGFRHLLLRTGRGASLEVRALDGTLPTSAIEVREHGMKLAADLAHGQKTGLFLDHRESRATVRRLARDLRVLNLYSYNGGFSVAAALGGALRVTSVDVAESAVRDAEENFARNDLDASKHRAVVADVPRFLTDDTEGPFDLVIADPPSFAPNERVVEKALESYVALHEACLKKLIPGGLYLAASCSSHVGQARFEETLLEGASRAGALLQLVDRWGAPFDHPRLLAFPEGDYLSCVLARRLG
jgi:23S rRNA (cytosine1962-C5)-methyltransferase